MQSKTKKFIAIILFVYPIPLFVITLVAYGILTFLIQAAVQSGDFDSMVIIGQVFNIILGILGILAMLGIFIGIPAGIILYVLARRQEKREKPSGQIS